MRAVVLEEFHPGGATRTAPSASVIKNHVRYNSA